MINQYLLSDYFNINHTVYQLLLPYLTDAVIAGGAARQAFLNTDFGTTDIDLYLPSEKSMQELKARLPRAQPLPPTAKYYAATFLLDKATIQIVDGIYPKIGDIFDSFDFTCCQFATKGDSLLCTPGASYDTLHRRLVATQYGTVKSSRLVKYALGKGFKPVEEKLQERLATCILQFLEHPHSDAELDEFIKGGH